MINHLSIQDFAVIENTSVDFNNGLNIITGETGAGKSVVIEGISLALGARADSSFIRTGCNKSRVQLAGDINGEEIIISREISANGKNICKLNGQLVTLTELRDTCQKLADIHGQYDNQFLLNPDNHIIFLDQYDKITLGPVKASVYNAYKDYSEKKNALSSLLQTEKEIKQKLDFYQFQLNEIDSLNLIKGEDQQLEEEISILENAEKIYASLEEVYQSVYDSPGSAFSEIYNALKKLEDISSYSKDIELLTNSFQDAYYTIEDSQSTIRNLKDSITFDPQKLDADISRLEAINHAKSKYGNSIEEILEYRNKINDILGDSIDLDHKKAKLTEELSASEEKLLNRCAALSKIRKDLAAKLEVEIQQQLQELNFNNSKIQIMFTTLSEPCQDGIDQVEILISTNKGEDLKPLSKVASGGEMSRIMLAFKKIVSSNDEIPTLIFDEIDNGISGITASIVSKKLKEIAKEHQIICITHLPQIAASGDTNYRIIKSVDSEHTYTTIEELDNESKVKEIARLLGGTNITKTTLASAKELIESTK